MAYKRGTPERRSLKGTKKRMIVKSTFPEVRMDGVMPTEEELKDFEVSNNQLKSIFCARQDKHQKRTVALLMANTFHTRRHKITTDQDNVSKTIDKFPALCHIDCVSLI